MWVGRDLEREGGERRVVLRRTRIRRLVVMRKVPLDRLEVLRRGEIVENDSDKLCSGLVKHVEMVRNMSCLPVTLASRQQSVLLVAKPVHRVVGELSWSGLY